MQKIIKYIFKGNGESLIPKTTMNIHLLQLPINTIFLIIIKWTKTDHSLST